MRLPRIRALRSAWWKLPTTQCAIFSPHKFHIADILCHIDDRWKELALDKL
jgi:hypothetical protein